MNEPYYIKYKNRKIPIYKTPFTKDDYQRILYASINVFGIHDQKTGKIKFYNLGESRLPVGNGLYDVNIDFFNGVKGIGLLVFSYYVLKTIIIGKRIKNRSKDHIKKVDDAIKGWEDLAKIKSPRPAQGETNGDHHSSGGDPVSSPNGWIVSNVIPESDRV